MGKTYISAYEVRRLEIIRESISIMAAGSKAAIEFGCNNGTITAILAEFFERIVAIDIEAEFLDKAKLHIKSENIEWRQHDLNLMLPSEFYGTFDVAIALEVIEHLNEPDQFLEKLRGCLKEKGKLLISTPNLLSLEAFTGLIWALKSGERYTAWDPSHKTLFRSDQIIRMLKKNGFALRRVTGYHYNIGKLPLLRRSLKIPLVKTSKWPFNRFGFNLIIEAYRNC